MVLSPLAKGHGYSNAVHYTHSSMLRTMQDIFGVRPYLGDAANAVNLSDLFIDVGLKSGRRLTNGQFEFSIFGAIPGTMSIIEASTDLVEWIPIGTNTDSRTTFPFFDHDATNFNQRFYRARLTR
jgi:hypothetical protein